MGDFKVATGAINASIKCAHSESDEIEATAIEGPIGSVTLWFISPSESPTSQYSKDLRGSGDEGHSYNECPS